MCGDIQILKEHGEELPEEELQVNKKIDFDYKDYILTKVQKGTWVIEHYYDFADDDCTIYSRLYLKKD